jgi:hypothetical protein
MACGEDCFSRIGAELIVLKWMVGFSLALDVAILARLFLH